MLKLVGISGPVKGLVCVLKNKNITIGRDKKNTLCVASQHVSQFHCKIVLEKDQLILEDVGSSHGTFVNGALVKMRVLQLQDQIFMGDCLFELQELSQSQAVVPQAFLASDGAILENKPFTDQEKKNPFRSEKKGFAKVKEIVLNKCYEWNEKVEWNYLCGSSFFLYVVLCLLLVMSPIFEASEANLQAEVMNRARFLARSLGDAVAGVVLSNNFNKFDLTFIENATAVKVAVVTDLENRILAPSHRATGYLETNPEAKLLIEAKNQYINGSEQGFCLRADRQTITAIEPIKVYDASKGKNMVVAMAVVSIDFNLTNLSFIQKLILYLETAIALLSMGCVVLWLGYQLLVRRILLMNEDLEKILRRDLDHMTRGPKIEELSQTLDLIDSLALRISNDQKTPTVQVESQQFYQFILDGLSLFIQVGHYGMVLLDEQKNVVQMNPVFEEISGIHNDNALGKDLVSLARDESFGVLVQDLLSRVSDGFTKSVTDEVEFSGVGYYIDMIVFEMFQSRCFMVTTREKKE